MNHISELEIKIHYIFTLKVYRIGTNLNTLSNLVFFFEGFIIIEIARNSDIIQKLTYLNKMCPTRKGTAI